MASPDKVLAHFDALGCANTRRWPDRADYIVGIKELLSKAGKLDFMLTLIDSKGPGPPLIIIFFFTQNFYEICLYPKKWKYP